MAINLSESQILEVFELCVSKEHKDIFESLFHQFVLNENLSEETALLIATKYDLRVPNKFTRSEKVMGGILENLNIKPNFNDPFEHMNNNEFNYFKGEDLEKLIDSACKIENILKHPKNLYLLSNKFNDNLMNLPDAFYIDLFENNYEYIKQALNHFLNIDNLFRIVKKYLVSAEDKAIAFEKVTNLLNFNGLVKVFGDSNVTTPEYLELIFKNNNKRLGLRVCESLLTNHHELMEKIVA